MQAVKHKSDAVTNVAVTLIDVDPTQPREVFDKKDLDRLVGSIASDGLLQPITLRKTGVRYVIVAGERRFRAVSQLGWPSIPSIVRELDDGAFRRLQMIENAVRTDLNPIEYARGLKQMLDEGLTAKEIGEALGEDPGNVSFHVAILECRPEVLNLVATGQLGVVVARQLAYLDYESQMAVLRRFQLHQYDATQQIAICQAKYAEMNQGTMFSEVVLSKEQVETVKQLRSAFNLACEAFGKLRAMEQKKPGSVVQTNLAQLDVARAQVTELKKNVDWLYRLLKQQEALNDGV